jgi:hypothetical protein
MGEYIYKVTAKTKTLADGTKANIAVFAYKPTFGWGADALNSKWASESKCHLAERFVETSKNYTGRVVLGETGDVAIPCNRGTFTDGWFDNTSRKQELMSV